MTNVRKIISLIETGSNYFLLKNPGSSKVQIMILNDKPSSFLIPTNNKTFVAVCPFKASVPLLYEVISHLDVSAEDFASTFGESNAPLESTSVIKTTTPHEYIESVKKGLDLINNSSIDKIVLAQTQWLEKQIVNPLSVYSSICTTPETYVYNLNIGGENWMGASPELFLKSDYQHCETVALAGTRLDDLSNVDWGEKEKQEQSIVGSFLVNEFSKLDFLNITVEPTFTKKIGQIEHICNPVKAEVPEGIDWHKVLNVLHPTPALAGYPKPKAIEYIDELESFDRSLYGGYIGIITQSVFEFFVNIRCARLTSNGVQFFAGAGINKDSIPEKEWEETQNKLSVMKRYFN